MRPAVLEVRNVSKVYKKYKNNFDRLKEIFFKKTCHEKFIANKNISFSLFEGETLGIIGVNGAGKSTILKIVAGVINPTSGNIVRRGRVIALLELGTGFNSEMNGHDNIYLNGSLIGMTKEEINQKKDEIIAFSELGEYIYEPIKTYSSGMKMRLAFSIAIFSEPSILIVDEALSVGDAHFSAKCTKALRQRKEQNMSIIYVSHDLNSLKLLCDRVLLLSNGEVIEEGNPEDVINKYNYLISKLNDDEEKMTIKNEEKSSFGTLDVEIFKVVIKGEKSHSNVISSGENVRIDVYIDAKVDMANMTVGIMIKDKFGQDIFGVNTFYHKKIINFEKKNKYICTFIMPLNIGIGKYSITSAIHSDETHLDNCSHWLDYGADFEVSGTVGHRFIGLCRLEPDISFNKLDSDTIK